MTEAQATPNDDAWSAEASIPDQGLTHVDSATRTFRKLDTRSPLWGTSSVTPGLSGVGPPPGFMMIQLLATFTIAGACAGGLGSSRTAAKLTGPAPLL
jgi:hypothetical protein